MTKLASMSKDRSKITTVLLDYGKVVAPEDGDPVVQVVYGAHEDDVPAYELFGSFR